MVLEEDKRVLTQMLGKLYLPEAVDDDKIRTLKLLIYSVQTVSVTVTIKSCAEVSSSAAHFVMQ